MIYNTDIEVTEEDKLFIEKTEVLKRKLKRKIPIVIGIIFLIQVFFQLDRNFDFNPVRGREFSVFLSLIIIFSIGYFVYNATRETNNNPKKTYKRYKIFYEVIDISAILPYIMVIVTLTNMFFISFSPISGSSMEPNFHDDEAVFFSHLNVKYNRFDVIILKTSKLSEPYLIKRIIGLPGEHVTIDHNEIYIDGVLLDQPFIDTTIYKTSCPMTGSRDFCEYSLGAEDYFVLGDNRSNSTDSRILGSIKQTDLFGKVIFKFSDRNFLAGAN
ncbi:MAG: signal peptidase I [Candidatus Izimaplasma sp.]|nr:signal peptidase I [Candidatus Izimaplasma bacterium]